MKLHQFKGGKTTCKDLEKDLGGHGEAVGDDGLLIWRFTLPAVQLQTPAAGQQALTVHLRGGNTGELTSCGGRDKFSRVLVSN